MALLRRPMMKARRKSGKQKRRVRPLLPEKEAGLLKRKKKVSG